MSDYVLEAKGFTLAYPGGRQVFAPLDFAVEAGETVALRGVSGAGKSSLLQCICGVIPKSTPAQLTGELLLYGRQPAEYPRDQMTRLVGMVFQNPETQLFCGTVELEAAFGLENLCVPPDEMHIRVRQALETVGLWEQRKASPAQLSGGQKQLLALAAVLAMRPRLLLLDEALSQLDAYAAAHVIDILRQLQAEGQSIVLADHSQLPESEKTLEHRTIWIAHED